MLPVVLQFLASYQEVAVANGFVVSIEGRHHDSTAFQVPSVREIFTLARCQEEKMPSIPLEEVTSYRRATE